MLKIYTAIESSSLFTRNKENMSRLNTLPMGSITPQQSLHLDFQGDHDQIRDKCAYNAGLQDFMHKHGPNMLRKLSR